MGDIVRLHKSDIVDTLERLLDLAHKGELTSIVYIIESDQKKFIKGFSVNNPLTCYTMMGLLRSIESDLNAVAQRNT